MTYHFVYDLPFVKNLLIFFIFPLLLVSLILMVILLIYHHEHKNDKDLIYEYKIDFYSLLIAICIVTLFFAIVLGFAIAFKQQMDKTGLETIIAYLVLISPLIPVGVLIILINKFVKLINDNPKKLKNERGKK